MEQQKNGRKAVKYLILAFCILLLLAAGAFLAWKIYEKAHILYDYVADKVDNIENKVNGIQYDVSQEVLFGYDRPEPYDFDYSWADQSPEVIAHAMGNAEGHSYTNSRDAFEQNYALGYRVFEVDFDLSDPELILIASHDRAAWFERTELTDDSDYTYDTFMQTLLFGKYEPLDYRGVVELLVEYPDAYFITDTKYTDFARVHIAFTQLTEYAKTVDPSVLNRIVPQIYHQEMLDWVMDIHPFKSVVYTLYQTRWTPEVVYEFCAKSGIRFVTLNYKYAQPDVINLWSKLGIRIAVHTLNDLETAQGFINQGVDMIYTDDILPGAL